MLCIHKNQQSHAKTAWDYPYQALAFNQRKKIFLLPLALNISALLSLHLDTLRARSAIFTKA
jgi:hypothetical protein